MSVTEQPRILEEFPRRRRGRPPKYDWDALFDGQIHVFYQGTADEFKAGSKDFDVPLHSFRALVHRTANARGMKAETRIDKDSNYVAFRFYDE